MRQEVVTEDEHKQKTIPLEAVSEEYEDMTMELSLSDFEDLRAQDTRVETEPPEDTSPMQPNSEPREVSTLQLDTVPVPKGEDFESQTRVLDASAMMRQAGLTPPEADDSHTLNDAEVPAAVAALRASLQDGSTQSFEIPQALIALAQADRLDETSMQLPHITAAMLQQVEQDVASDLEESTTPDEEEPETEIIEFVAEIDAQGCVRIPFALLEARIVHPGTLLRIRAKIIKETT